MPRHPKENRIVKTSNPKFILFIKNFTSLPIFYLDSMSTILFDTRSKKSASDLPGLLGTKTIPLFDSKVFGND